MQYKHFSAEERETIQRGHWEKKSVRAIARGLGRSPASVSRELRRNYPKEHKTYTPRLAHERALYKRTCRGREKRLKNDRVRAFVTAELKRRRSPEQIAGTIKREVGETISHEAVYQFIYAQISYNKPKRGREDLRSCLRRRRKRRVPHGARKGQRVLKPKGTSIDERPVVVDRRSRIGDWEGDTVEGADHASGINTIVERKTGLVFITRLKDKKSAATRDAVVSRLSVVPESLRHTITLDNGFENARWREIEEELGVACYFAHPYHSWERGTNENTNGLIRDYFPKGTDFRTISDAELAYVERELNERPRKRLGWRSPLQAFGVALQG